MLTSVFSSEGAQTQRASLLKLPAELRHQIWTVFYTDVCAHHASSVTLLDKHHPQRIPMRTGKGKCPSLYVR